MTTERISIAPSPDLIIAEIAREGMSWEKALGEPIDNSLDAGATRIVVGINKKARRVSVQDNGVGCPEPHRMLVSGYTTKRGARNTLGRYGVGLKHSSYYFCGKDGATRIVTSHGGECRSVRVVWNDIITSGAWEINAPVGIEKDEIASLLIDGKGTSITFANVRCGFLAPNVLDDILKKLSFVFSPALRAGRQIEIDIGDKRQTLSAPREPSWSEPIEFDVEIDHRKAHVRAGILAVNDKSGRRGFSFCFGHRVIVADTNDGCGTYSTAGFAGIVDLDATWNLGQNKSQVVDEAWPRLCEEIEARVRPLLEKLKNSTHQLRSEALRIATADRLNSVLGQGQAKRPNEQGKKRKKSANSDRKVRDATIVDGAGVVRGRRPKGGLTIDFETNLETKNAARVDSSGTRVYLNRNCWGVADAEMREDDRFLALIAGTAFAHFADQQRLPGCKEFEVTMGLLLSEPLTLESTARPALISRPTSAS